MAVSYTHLHATGEAEKLRHIDLLTYQIEELEQANLRENEKEQLMERKTAMMHAEKIASAITAAKACLLYTSRCV